MAPKIIYMTNIDRRYFMMRRALDELIAERCPHPHRS